MDNQKDSAGYLPLNRGFFEHNFWMIKREFSKAEAWIDLLQLVSYDEKEKTLWINEKPINYGRGQYPASYRFLLDRWNWKSLTKVENFLKYLKNKDMIKIETKTGQNVVTICKYDIYNPVKIKKGQSKDTKKDSARTVQGQCKDETNKGNKDNKDIYIDFEGLTEREIEYWKNFNKWFQEQPFPNIRKFKSQLKPVEFIKLQTTYGGKSLADILAEIENHGKKYESVYLTANNWLKRNQEQAA